MKKLLLALCMLAGVVLSGASPAPKSIVIGKKSIMELKPGNFVILLPAKPSKVLKFAASELQTILSQAMGAKIPVTTAPQPGKHHIRLGITPEAVKAGLDPEKLIRDGFYIRTVGKDIFIAGRDDSTKDPVREIQRGGGWSMHYEHATIFGVYDFLERFAGVRFYFPGELGTIVPKRKVLSIPQINIVERPDFKVRTYSAFYDGVYFEGPKADAVINPNKNLNLYRNRYPTEYMPCCHGINGFGLVHRFGKSNPEYFVKMSNGTRLNDPDVRFAGQLCWTSPVKEEIYKDLVSYFTGRPPQERGVWWNKRHTWAFPVFRNPYVDVMPQDSFHRCYCKNCEAAYNPGKYYATELVWGNVIDWANRLKKAGIKGQLNMMAYPPYRGIPKRAIPDNVNVMVAETGPWILDPKAAAVQDGEIKAWVKKLGRKVWIWNYANKFGRLAIKGVPAPTPRAVGAYYSRMSPYIFGAFMESECDRYLYFYLNFHVFSKVAWDNKCNWQQIINEHHELMFGKAAPVMKQLFEFFEDTWLKKIYGRTVDTPIGPVVSVPSDYDLWHKIYSPTVLADLRRSFDKAASMVPKNSLEAKRIALFRREYLNNLEKAAQSYLNRTSAAKGVTMRFGGAPVQLIPHDVKKGADPELVTTRVSAALNAKTIDFTFECEEPRFADTVAAKRAYDDKETWRDNSVEVFLNPSGDKKNYYQLIVNSKGSLTDFKWFRAGASSTLDASWRSDAAVAVTPVKGGFKVTLSIPLARFPGLKKSGFPVNFGRSRVLKSQGNCQIHYKWSRYAKGFHDLENYGTVGPCKNEVIYDPGFDTLKPRKPADRFWGVTKNKKFYGWYTNNQKPKDFATLDSKVFFSAPYSMKLVCTDHKKGRSIGQYITGKLKSNTKYRISFKVKLENVVQMSKSASGFCVNIWDDANRWFPKGRWLAGTMDWTYLSFIHKTSAKAGNAKVSYIHARLMNCTGTAWVDDISIEEIE